MVKSALIFAICSILLINSVKSVTTTTLYEAFTDTTPVDAPFYAGWYGYKPNSSLNSLSSGLQKTCGSHSLLDLTGYNNIYTRIIIPDGATNCTASARIWGNFSDLSGLNSVYGYMANNNLINNEVFGELDNADPCKNTLPFPAYIDVSGSLNSVETSVSLEYYIDFSSSLLDLGFSNFQLICDLPDGSPGVGESNPVCSNTLLNQLAVSSLTSMYVSTSYDSEDQEFDVRVDLNQEFTGENLLRYYYLKNSSGQFFPLETQTHRYVEDNNKVSIPIQDYLDFGCTKTHNTDQYVYTCQFYVSFLNTCTREESANIYFDASVIQNTEEVEDSQSILVAVTGVLSLNYQDCTDCQRQMRFAGHLNVLNGEEFTQNSPLQFNFSVAQSTDFTLNITSIKEVVPGGDVHDIPLGSATITRVSNTSLDVTVSVLPSQSFNLIVTGQLVDDSDSDSRLLSTSASSEGVYIGSKYIIVYPENLQTASTEGSQSSWLLLAIGLLVGGALLHIYHIKKGKKDGFSQMKAVDTKTNDEEAHV